MRITKIELQQINTRLADENAALRAQLSQLQADNARLKAERDAALEDENDRAYERDVVRAETPAPTPEEGRVAFFCLSRVKRAALAKLACEQLGVRSVTPAQAGVFLLSR